MQFKVLSITLLIGGVFSAPTSIHELVARDGRLIQKAWSDCGIAYTNLNAAFKELQPNLLRPFSASRIPLAHQQVLDILQQTAQVLIKTPKISTSETASLILPARTLTSNINAAFDTITKAKPMLVRSGEQAEVAKMLKVQYDAYVAWSNALNTLLPTFQKSMGQAFADEVIAAYKKEITAYST